MLCLPFGVCRNRHSQSGLLLHGSVLVLSPCPILQGLGFLPVGPYPLGGQQHLENPFLRSPFGGKLLRVPGVVVLDNEGVDGCRVQDAALLRLHTLLLLLGFIESAV